MSFNKHERSADSYTDIWLTPRRIITELGPFDLDPCAAPDPKPWPTAAKHYTYPEQDGLALPWEGMVWLNPPYSDAAPWLAKLSEHGRGISLVFARTETRMFFESVWSKYGGVLFVRGRLKFCKADGSVGGTAGAPSVLIGYGDEALRRLANCSIDGHLVVNSAAILIDAEGNAVRTWRQAIHAALAGKKMRLRDIYAAVENTPKAREAKSRGVEWRSKIRRVLQEHFTPVERGVWAPVAA